MKYILFLVLFITACTTTKQIEYVKSEHIVRDTISQHDTTMIERSTIIREVDSAYLASLGIELANNKRAWLIEKDNMQKQISNLQRNYVEVIHDTSYIDKEVIKETPAKLSWFQRLRINIGTIALVATALLIIYIIARIFLRK